MLTFDLIVYSFHSSSKNYNSEGRKDTLWLINFLILLEHDAWIAHQFYRVMYHATYKYLIIFSMQTRVSEIQQLNACRIYISLGKIKTSDSL